ncbi:hypothetical protein KC19_11G159100 [Ceratodon purpureus]|uniref:Uncharacterized protein n=1 Tax=Ceratodon purpureus TaxID=3225 RepID=A0A8T0GJB9_CERPU|nr:hypothetical protein KC19_11G159100 [Ceratodon purpureus]
MDSEDEEAMVKQAARRTFAALRPVCIKLLETVTTQPDACAELLIALQGVVRTEPVAGLQACLDYLLFPLVMLLDAAVACREKKGVEGHRRLNVGDKVAEGVVVCLRAVLEKCPCQSVSQMTTLIGKLTKAALLSPVEASEEFRHGIVMCIRSVFQALQPCKSVSCSCKYVLPSPFTILHRDPGELYEGYTHTAMEEDVIDEEFTTIDYATPEPCPLGFLQSLDMGPAIGHLLSLLLQIADREAVLGGVGSGKLREDTLSTLRVILLKVGNADALAFFFPGVVSGFTKAIRSSMVTSKRSVITATYKSVGAAGSTGALEESLRGLTELLVLVLADSRNWACLSEMDSKSSDTGSNMDQVEAALEKLQIVLLKEDTKSAEESLQVSGDSEESSLSVGLSSSHNRAAVNAEAPTPGSPLRVERDRKWLESTVTRLENMLSINLPLLCAHPSAAVRLAVVESAAVLLFSCGGTLESCTSLFLECLLALACDEWQYVASTASSSLVFLFSIDEVWKSKGGNEGTSVHHSRCLHRSKIQKQAILNLLQRLLERLPQAVFSGNETLAVLHARRLAAALYFVGPEAVCSSFLVSLEACQRFANIMLQCLSFSSSFAGPMDLSVLSTASKSPALLVMSDPKTGTEDDHPETSKKQKQQNLEEVVAGKLLPRMPPWLSQNAQRVYKALASIIRLVGRAAASGRPGDLSLMRVVETLLETLQRAADELCQQQEQASHSLDIGSGQAQRASAVSACVLSELVYGTSRVWTDELVSLFGGRSSKDSNSGPEKWQFENETEVKTRISECMGGILHDYLRPELWDLPVDAGAFSDRGHSVVDMPLLHVLQDNAMLQQVLVEGVGVFGLALGKAFEDGGFMALVLYPLLEKLASTNSNVSYAADLALRAICYYCGYQSVKELVIQNADYVVDSLCRQLRHIELYPQAPSLLAAILKHTGAAPHLLPLLEEPMQGIVLELEILARSRHPQYTVSLLRALREIAKAARVESRAMFAEATRQADEVRVTLQGEVDVHSEAGQTVIEQLITEIQDRERRRKSVASVGTSCLQACAPLLASQDIQTCLLALGVIEDGIAGLADMDATFPSLQAQRTEVENFLRASATESSDPDAAEPFGAKDESSRSNLLLPSMNQVWPQLVPCLRHTQPAVLVRVLEVMASLITICGGQFFTRRIAKDALPLLLKLLRDGPSLIMTRPSDAFRPKSSKELFLLRNQGSEIKETGTSPAAVLKVQLAVLKCIGVIAGDQKSAPALESTYKPIVSWVVALGCKVQALRGPAAETLVALSNVDADLVWLIVADLVYDGHSHSLPSPGDEFPTFVQIFPPLSSPKEALWVQYSSHNGDAKVDRKAAQELLAKLGSLHKNVQ